MKCDLFLIDFNIWIEIDGIDREKRKKWLGKQYDYWIHKLNIYKEQKLDLRIIKNLKDLQQLIISLAQLV